MLRGLATDYVLFFIHLESRRVEIAGITQYPNEAWMMQIARNVTMSVRGALGEIGQGRLFIETDSVWRSIV